MSLDTSRSKWRGLHTTSVIYDEMPEKIPTFNGYSIISLVQIVRHNFDWSKMPWKFVGVIAAINFEQAAKAYVHVKDTKLFKILES